MKNTLTLLFVAALSTSASAADLQIEGLPASIAAESPWDGLYVGLHGGLGAGGEEDNQTEEIGGMSPDTIPLTGWLLGAHAGASFQAGAAVFGIEGIIDVGSIRGTVDYDYVQAGFGTLSFTSTWQASLNARAGFTALESLLLYGSVGIAVAGGELIADEGFSDLTRADTQTHVGWNVAVGAEYLLDENWSARIEARYSDFGIADYVIFNDDPASATFNLGTITGGLSYRF